LPDCVSDHCAGEGQFIALLWPFGAKRPASAEETGGAHELIGRNDHIAGVNKGAKVMRLANGVSANPAGTVEKQDRRAFTAIRRGRIRERCVVGAQRDNTGLISTSAGWLSPRGERQDGAQGEQTAQSDTLHLLLPPDRLYVDSRFFLIKQLSCL